MSEEFNENTDYYELLGCDPDCTQEALKKAYRKAAMKWHPDRNHGNAEEATRVFQLIEHAYSILSDDHERAWYDGHRNLETNEEGQIQASKVDIMSLFHACAYIGFSEKSNGFYPVFRKAFATIAEEENAEAPGFGNADSPWEEVNAFYAYWTCFKTKRSFAYVDIYRLKDAPNAMYRRAMKQDNEKARQKAEREFVSQVRELASYVKKRDPRVINHLKEIEEQRALREAEEQAKRDAEKQKLLEELDRLEENGGNQIEYTEDDLIYIRQFDNDEEKEQKNIDKWSCPFCKREIKNENAFRAHCNTKVHQKKIAGPKKRFLNDPSLYEHTAKTYVLLCMNMDEIRQIEGDEGAENIDLDHLDDEEEDNEYDNNNANEEEEEEEDQRQKQKNRPISKKEQRKMKKKEENEKSNQTEQKKGGPNNKNLSKKEQRRLQILEEKAKKQQQMENEQKAKIELKKAKNEQRKKKEMDNANNLEPNDDDDQNDTPQNQNQQKKLTKKEMRRLKQQQQQNGDDNDDADENEQEAGGQKNQQQNNNQPRRLPKNVKNPPAGWEMCRKCRLLFPSRKKLFDHLKETGHATAV
ncbi:hypothetical protein M9Y10_021837 [Tritrichomonas musculus]|uniref:J domain-containing protein n=1 Tax=Tritrichomonas musculus TaxID=1915356 RepID=A0ABR2KSN5_9EUKA